MEVLKHAKACSVNTSHRRKNMRKLERRSILAWFVLVVLVLSACSSDKKTGIESDFSNPITPSEGFEWPPQSLRTAFALGGLSQPEGIEDVYYYSESGIWITPGNGRMSEDYLSIDFGRATIVTVATIENYFDSNGFVMEKWSGHTYFDAYGWKIGNNILYWFNSEVAANSWWSGGYIEIERVSGSSLKFRWPSSSEQAIFGLIGWAMPPGISDQYFFISRGGYSSRIFSRFAAASEETTLLFAEYFESVADGGYAWSDGGEFWGEDDSADFWYGYGIYNGIGFFELYRFEKRDGDYRGALSKQDRESSHGFYYHLNTIDGVKATEDRFEEHPMRSASVDRERRYRSSR